MLVEELPEAGLQLVFGTFILLDRLERLPLQAILLKILNHGFSVVVIVVVCVAVCRRGLPVIETPGWIVSATAADFRQGTRDFFPGQNFFPGTVIFWVEMAKIAEK